MAIFNIQPKNDQVRRRRNLVVGRWLLDLQFGGNIQYATDEGTSKKWAKLGTWDFLRWILDLHFGGNIQYPTEECTSKKWAKLGTWEFFGWILDLQFGGNIQYPTEE